MMLNSCHSHQHTPPVYNVANVHCSVGYVSYIIGCANVAPSQLQSVVKELGMGKTLSFTYEIIEPCVTFRVEKLTEVIADLRQPPMVDTTQVPANEEDSQLTANLSYLELREDPDTLLR